MARVAEAISAYILFDGSRWGSLMPVAQFNPFEKLDMRIMQAGGEDAAYKLWHQLSGERNRYLDGVEGELTRRGGPPAGIASDLQISQKLSLPMARGEIH
jgi:hypothetical protein